MLAFISNSVIAQDDDRAQFQIGIKAGTNFANVYDEQGDDFVADGKFGFAGGLFFTIPIVRVIGFQPEILFSQKGFKAKGSLLGSNYGLTRTTNFIDIPLYLTIKPLNQLTILAGPQFSYLMKRKDVVENAVNNVEIIQQFDNDNIRKNIFGVAAGFDVNLNKVILGTRAGWDLNTNNGDGTSQTPRYKNAWLQATLGIRLI
jgi:hypothetical protein